MEGTHEAFAPRRHTRGILAIHGLGWWIVDHILGPGYCRDGALLARPPFMDVLARSDPARLQAGERRPAAGVGDQRAVSRFSRQDRILWRSRSPVYGAVEPAPVCRTTRAALLPATVATFIPATGEVADQLVIEAAKVERLPGPLWHASAFRVRWTGGAMVILVAVEQSGQAGRDTAAPTDRWGTAELQTDARVAAADRSGVGPLGSILVNGAL